MFCNRFFQALQIPNSKSQIKVNIYFAWSGYYNSTTTALRSYNQKTFLFWETELVFDIKIIYIRFCIISVTSSFPENELVEHKECVWGFTILSENTKVTAMFK